LKVGVTGHRKLTNPAAWDWVRTELTALLQETARPLIGLTSLAIGADQLFAEVVLQLQGEIQLIVPFPNYDRTFDNQPDLAQYHRLKSLAKHLEIRRNGATEEQAYLEAGQRIVDLSDWMVAVWDGQPARGLGGTADIVQYAAATGKRCVQLNPVTQPPSASQTPRNR
jgi:hypothetical protein